VTLSVAVIAPGTPSAILPSRVVARGHTPDVPRLEPGREQRGLDEPHGAVFAHEAEQVIPTPVEGDHQTAGLDEHAHGRGLGRPATKACVSVYIFLSRRPTPSVYNPNMLLCGAF
jgi:hypothetical protein